MVVRMLTTAAGPDGVWPKGSVIRLNDEVAQRLIDGGFAVAHDDADFGNSEVERETAEAQPAAERAVAPQQRRKAKPKAKG